MKKLLTIIAILTVGLVNAQLHQYTITSSIDTISQIASIPATSYTDTNISQDTLYISQGSNIQIKFNAPTPSAWLKITNTNINPGSGSVPQTFNNADIIAGQVPGLITLTWTNTPTQSINQLFTYNWYISATNTGPRYFKVYFKVIPTTTTTTISTLSQITNTSTISTIDTTNCVVIHSTTLNTTYTTQSANNTVSLTLTGNTQTLTTIGQSTTIPFSDTLTVIKYRFNQSNNQWFNYPKTFIYSNTLTIIGNSLPQNTVSITSYTTYNTNCDTITTGINELGVMNDELRIYPNPANSYVNIENSNNQTIEFINLNGQTVLKSKESIVNIESLKQGIYFIKIGNTMSKFVKE